MTKDNHDSVKNEEEDNHDIHIMINITLINFKVSRD